MLCLVSQSWYDPRPAGMITGTGGTNTQTSLSAFAEVHARSFRSAYALQSPPRAVCLSWNTLSCRTDFRCRCYKCRPACHHSRQSNRNLMFYAAFCLAASLRRLNFGTRSSRRALWRIFFSQSFHRWHYWVRNSCKDSVSCEWSPNGPSTEALWPGYRLWSIFHVSRRFVPYFHHRIS